MFEFHLLNCQDTSTVLSVSLSTDWLKFYQQGLWIYSTQILRSFFLSQMLSLINILQPYSKLLFGRNETGNTQLLFPGSFILSQQLPRCANLTNTLLQTKDVNESVLAVENILGASYFKIKRKKRRHFDVWHS